MLNKMKHLLVAVLATVSIGVATGVASEYINGTTTVSASRIAHDGPWEKDSNGYSLLQPLHNGNEIYYSIAPNTKYHKYANSAAAAWNNLGVVNLIQVPYGDSRSQITVRYSDDDSDSDEDAVTSFNSTSDINGYAYLNGATITFYDDMNDDTAIEREATVEHEFGHALGFAHDNRILNNGRAYYDYYLTMNGEDVSDDTYTLGGIEQRTLAHHYGITPDQWLDTNC